MRLVAFLVGLCCVVISVRPADACGFWTMNDVERGTDVGYLVNSAKITKGEKRTLGAQYFDTEAKTGLRVVKDRKVVLDIRGGKLLHRGKPVADVADTSITFGKKVFTIELADAPSQHGMPTYKLTVKRGDTLVLTSDEASSLCAGMGTGMTAEQSREEVRRRVFYYLAWREGKA